MTPKNQGPDREEVVASCLFLHVDEDGRLQVRTQLLLSLDETAQQLGLSLNTVYKLVRSGEILSFHIGRARRISAAELQRWIEGREMEERERIEAIRQSYRPLQKPATMKQKKR